VPFALRPVFNAPSNSVGFPEEYLAFRNPLADPELAEIFSAHLERQPSVSDAGGSGFVKALEQVIREEATRGRGIAIQDCARLLGTSVRGLQRDCAAQGLSFRDIRNDVFMMLASEWLRSTDLSITDIALKLGFSESSSFSRAFRNHVGHSPSHLRRRTAAEGFK
jgi:AraC-like DNA-binding protein